MKEYKGLPVYIQAVDGDQGIVEAVPAVMGNIDHQDDRILNGAFTKTIQERGSKVRILDNHNMSSTLAVVGLIKSLREIGRDELPLELLDKYPEAIGGLAASVQFLMDTPEGEGVFKRLKAGAIDEWSIGYDAVDKEMVREVVNGEEKVVRNIKQIRLYELSPVIFGANSATTTLSAKNDNADADPDEGKPWRIEEADGSFCVYKLDGDGNLDGEALQCYESRDDAVAYMSALYASENAADQTSVENNKDADMDTETKEGRVLSGANARRIIGAMTSLLDTLEAAGIDLPGWQKQETDDEEKSSAPADAGRADERHDEKAGPGDAKQLPPTDSDMLAQTELLRLELSLLEVT